MSVKNLTPHAITLCGADGRDVEIPPSGQIARVKECLIKVDQATPFGGCEGGIDISVIHRGEVTVEGLPPRDGHTDFIVSRMVLDACPDRCDLFCPGELRRDEKGRITGCYGLITNP